MRIVATFVSVLIAGTLSFTIAQEHMPSTDQLLQSVPSLSSIPGLENFNLSSVETEDTEKLAKEKCEKNGGPAAYSVAKDSLALFLQCLQSLVNVTQLQTEMNEARPRGELNTVFKKYCRRVPNLMRCMRNVTDAIEPCLESEERDSIKNVHHITNSFLEFICYNEGDRIAMFIAAGGVECFRDKRQAVLMCANETLSSYVQVARPVGGAVPGLSSGLTLVLGLEQCRGIDSFRTCTVRVIEECNDPTPANVVESFFDFVKKVTPCEALLEKLVANSTDNSGFGRQPASRLPVSTSNGSIGHTESSTSSVENSCSKTNSAEPDNQYLQLKEGKGENQRIREKCEKTKLDLLELEIKNKRDTGMQNSQLHELAMGKLSLEIERLKEARKYEQELYELQIEKIRLEIHAQEFKLKSELDLFQ